MTGGRTPAERGFTLLEMSIVLALIGVLIAGILLGQSLVRQAQLASVMTDFTRFTAAAHQFDMKYGAMPGDMPNATTYWGAVATPTNTTACYQAVGTGTQTCDGDGNGQIGWCGYEQFRAWQHLADAGLIEGKYPQSVTTQPPCATGPIVYNPGIDAPKSRLPGASYLVGWLGTIAPGDGSSFPNAYGTVIDVMPKPGSGSWGVMSPEEAKGLDGKFDDGYPATGQLVVVDGAQTGSNCTTTHDPDTARYWTAGNNDWQTATACAFHFLTGL